MKRESETHVSPILEKMEKYVTTSKYPYSINKAEASGHTHVFIQGISQATHAPSFHFERNSGGIGVIIRYLQFTQRESHDSGSDR